MKFVAIRVSKMYALCPQKVEIRVNRFPFAHSGMQSTQKESQMNFKIGNFMKYSVLKVTMGIFLGLSLPHAQDMDVQGDGSNAGIILQGKNINPSSQDLVGLGGVSTPIGWYGIGVKGWGGYRGVEGRCDQSLTTNLGTGSRAGIYGAAYNGGTNYGVQAFAIGSTGTNYGVYATATGTNSRAGYFSGDLEYTGALVHTSDRKLKKNIVDIRNCLNVLSKMPPKEFEYRTDEFPTLHLPKTHQVGLIAQDVETAMPELVRESTMPVAADGEEGMKGDPSKKGDTYKTVDYIGLIPVLVGAIQEQQDEINALRKKLAGGK